MRILKWIVPFFLLETGCLLLAPAADLSTPAASAGYPSAVTTSPTGSDSGRWLPGPQMSWQWQLAGDEVDTSFDADVYDLDAFDTSAEVVASLHLQGRRAICYISVGSREDWRPDAAQFPAETLGRDYEGWEGEQWLDIRRIDLLEPVLLARMDLCKAKGFDGIEPDNIDGYQNETGFPITAEDQLRFNRWLAQAAHARGLAIALKNDADQARELFLDFDFALAEDCFEQGWCELLMPFLQSGKLVLDAEYTDTGMTLEKFCPQAKALGIQAILKHRNLDAWRQACP
ncbi:MAG: endo alpha-1,4 polygalactosaminidase [Anaerolineales bacterium]|nr:endo alpha-1,4 polygalactosaminidase [Anaerolineales bacterium]